MPSALITDDTLNTLLESAQFTDAELEDLVTAQDFVIQEIAGPHPDRSEPGTEGNLAQRRRILIQLCDLEVRNQNYEKYTPAEYNSRRMQLLQQLPRQRFF